MATNDITYKSKITDASYELNKHFTGIMDYGVYSGLSPKSVNGMNIVFEPGIFLDRYGRRIAFSEETVAIAEGSMLGDRIDTVCVKVAVTGTTIGSAFLVILKGDFSKFPVPSFNNNNDIYPIAYVKVQAGINSLAISDIQVANQILTHDGMFNSKIQPVLNQLYGTKKIEGLQASFNSATSMVDITPGAALISGGYFKNEATTSLRLPEFPDTMGMVTGTDVKVLGISSQPKVPIRIKVEVETSEVVAELGYIRIEGLNENGTSIYEIVNSANVLNLKKFVFASSKYFTSVDRIYFRDFSSSIISAKCYSLNKAYIYGIKHGVSSYIPFQMTTVKKLDTEGYILICGMTVSSGKAVMDEEPAKSFNVMMGTVIKDGLLLNGTQGTKITHGLGNTNYFYYINPIPANKQEAITVGAVYADKNANDLVIYNTGSARCAVEVMLVAGV